MGCEYNNTYEDIRINICTKYKQEKISTINKRIEEAIKKIPENIINHLTKNKFEINVLSKRDLNTKMYLEYNGITNKEKRKEKFKALTKYFIFGNRWNGCFIWGKCCIYVMLCRDMEKAILHEIGHFLDYIGKSPLNYEDKEELKKQDKKIPVLINRGIKPFRKSGNFVFLTIYEKEKKKYHLWERYYKKKYSEHFAESFAKRLMEDSKFIRKFPETAKYIEEFIKNF